MFGIGGGSDKTGGKLGNQIRRPDLRVITADSASGAKSPPIDDETLFELVEEVRAGISDSTATRGQTVRKAGDIVNKRLLTKGIRLSAGDLRSIVKLLLEQATASDAVKSGISSAPAVDASRTGQLAGEARRVSLLPEQAEGQLFHSVYTQPQEGAAIDHRAVEIARDHIHPIVMDKLDLAAATQLPRNVLERQLADLVADLLNEHSLQLNQMEQRQLSKLLLDDMLGLGPMEPLLADETVTDIMVNGPKQVYVERQGKLHITDVTFRDDAHVLNVAKRIVSRVGRRIDETTPLVDARLLDGSRVNVIIPPLAIDGPTISIRKFAKKKITLQRMVETNNVSVEMAKVLQIAARARLNILISGGTGSGKTTLLNAMSRMIDHGERIVTIEDAAELQLQQPHVVRLETRPASIEGAGEVMQRDLLKNALRMRPDRIILGEVRGAEALDMLQAMNTGHDGSMCTLHANRPREALTRLENMVGMAGFNMPAKAVRQQIASAIHLVIQIARMRDGIRRVTNVMEIVGMEGDVITAQDLFVYEFEGEGADGRLRGRFRATGVRPAFLPKAAFYGLDKELMEIV